MNYYSLRIGLSSIYINLVAPYSKPLLIVGLSYFSRLRHEMRVAFWWKLNWSWLCVIKTSYNEAMKPITDDEVDPFPDDDAFSTGTKEIDLGVVVKKEEDSTVSPLKSSDQDTISDPMEDIVASQSTFHVDVPEHLRQYWDTAKRLNARPRWASHLGEDEWLSIGEVLVELCNELAKYGLLDMDLGFWENEIMHRTPLLSWLI